MADFSTPSPCTHLYIFWMTPSIPPVAYVLNGWSISQPQKIRTFEHYEKINGSVGLNKHSGHRINQKPNSAMSVMLCTGTTFVKKNSCLVA